MGKHATMLKRGGTPNGGDAELVQESAPVAETHFTAGNIDGAVTAIVILGDPAYSQARARAPGDTEWIVGSVANPGPPAFGGDPSVGVSTASSWQLGMRWGGTPVVDASWSPWSAGTALYTP